MSRILLSHEGGSEKGNQLIKNLFVKRFANSRLGRLEDGAILDALAKPVFTTDSFTVSPCLFPGGDIGKLAVAGTCNDLAVSSASPKYLSAAFIIEEGFAVDKLEQIADSMAAEAKINGAEIVCGDTKIVPQGALDGIFINTSGIGEAAADYAGCSSLNDNHSIIVSGPVGDHGAVILMKKKGLEFESGLQSDCRSLWPDIKFLLDHDIRPAAMRDVTRGGLAGILHEWAGASGFIIEAREEAIPVREEVTGFGELTGIDPLHLACEGVFLLAVPAAESERTLQLMRSRESMAQAAIIGKVAGPKNGRPVRLFTSSGAVRNLEMPSGEQLPRIC